jgi:hypothetical protein
MDTPAARVWTVRLTGEQLFTALTALECHGFADPEQQRTADVMVRSIVASVVDQLIDREPVHH